MLVFSRYVEDKDVLYQEFQIKRLVAGEITYFEFEVKVLEGSSQQFKKLAFNSPTSIITFRSFTEKFNALS